MYSTPKHTLGLLHDQGIGMNYGERCRILGMREALMHDLILGQAQNWIAMSHEPCALIDRENIRHGELQSDLSVPDW